MKTFLTARWENLVFINYKVNPDILLPFMPAGTVPDSFNGDCFVSLVGFMFLDTKVLRIGFPFHRNFEEFNLRFYVRRKHSDGWKRGVVFVKEIVPRKMISAIAYMLYGEKYFYHPMRNKLVHTDARFEIEYSFLVNEQWNFISVAAAPQSQPIKANSEEEFITEHYWGYTKMHNGKTSEYRVEHPKWNIYPVLSYKVQVDTAAVYGGELHRCFAQAPSSVFVADGSPVRIFTRTILKAAL